MTRSRQPDELFRAAFECSPIAMVLVDGNGRGRIVLVNAEAEKMFGYPRDELIGRSVEMLVPARFRDAHPSYRNAYSAAPDARPMGVGRDLFGLRKDGREFPVEIGLNPITTPEGSFVLSAIADITGRKRDEERLRAVAAELARSNTDLEQFAYAASHDLQEPLRMVTSYVQLLERRLDPQPDDDMRRYLGHAVDGAERMRSMIRDLLEYSRVGTRGGEPRELDLGDAVREALANLRAVVAEARAEVAVGELPRIEADPTQMVRLFQNLLSNSLKFRDKAPVRIRISARQVGSSWEIEVADNGIGLEPRFAERIFGVFQRLHSREHHPGTGIGLAICKKIVDRHGGSIRVESEPYRGARFYVTLTRRMPRSQ